jgi:transposase, IS30 family
MVVGRRPSALSVHRSFWSAVVAGASTEAAAGVAGVDRVTGIRWFVKAGGMPPISLAPPSSRYLSLAEREEIAVLRAQKVSKAEIGRRLGRHPSTIGRELARNCRVGRPGSYRAVQAQWWAEDRARRPKPAKLAGHQPLRDYVADKLAGREHWSPEQISRRLPVEFPDDERMRVSHEAIYQSLFVQGRGGLRRELTAHLRTGRALRKPQRRVDGRLKRQIPPALMISERPAEVEDRAVPGHWEGDLITGTLNKSAVGTLVERTTRFVMLLHLPDDHGAEAVRDAISAEILTLPEALRRSLTWDQGAELARHAEITIDTGLDIYFCDPHSPWQRGSNENTNGLLRQYLPKGSDLRGYSAADLRDIADALNGRPRKALGYATPAEKLHALLLPHKHPPVATTG